jgi:hypothetical protein
MWKLSLFAMAVVGCSSAVRTRPRSARASRTVTPLVASHVLQAATGTKTNRVAICKATPTGFEPVLPA